MIILIRYGCTLLFVLVPPALKAQQPASSEAAWALRINPAALIDPYGPSSVQLGVEHAVTPRLSIALEGGYFFQYAPTLKDAPDEAFHGQSIRVQCIRWSDKQAERGLGFDVAYKHTEGTCRDSIKPDGAPPYSKDYEVSRRVVIIRGYGVERLPWGERFRADVYYGLGLRLKFAQATGISGQELEDIDNRDEYGDSSMIPQFMHETGDHWYPDLVLGLRIAYLLR